MLDILTAVPSPSAPSTWDIVGIGANAVDHVYILPTSLAGGAPDAKLRIKRHVVSSGGQVMTMLAAAQKLGMSTEYIGTIGAGDDAEILRADLARSGIHPAHLVPRDAPQPFAVILIDERTGERIVLWDRDARLRLEPRDVPVDVIARARLVHVDDVDLDASTEAARLARVAGVPTICDVERAADRVDELIALVTCPIFAAPGLSEISGIEDPERALRKFRKRHSGLLTVTLGPAGAMALDQDTIVHAPAFSVRAVDTTGAGDVFRGGFAVAWLEKRATAEVLRFANAAAALSCTRLGAMAGAPGRDEVDRLLTA